MSNKLTKNYSRTTKVLSFAAVIAVTTSLVIGGSIISNNKANQASSAQVATTANTVTDQRAVLGAQTTTADYVITVTSISQQNGAVAVGLRITNSSQVTLQTSPFLQFSIVNVKTNESRKPFLPTNAVLYEGGPLAPNTSNQGVLYFNSFDASQQFELRFLTDVSSNDYIVVPLIVAAN